MLINTISNYVQSQRGGLSEFSIANSFYFDKTNNYFTIPNSDLDPNIFGGTNNKYTIYFMVKRDSTTGNQYILSNLIGANMFLIYLDGNSNVVLITNNGAQVLKGTQALTSTSEWYFVSVSVDLETTSNCKITINDVADTIATNTLTATTGVATGDYWFGARNNLTNYISGNYPLIGVVDRVTTTQENTDVYNLGKPLDLNTYFGSNCKMFLNADNSGSTAQFTWTDSVNSLTATSFNMVDGDKQAVTPY
jgi:hypothetical protein